MVAAASLNAIKPHRFKNGNGGGPGNPLSKQVNQLRSALAKAVTPAHIDRIAKALIKRAEKGDVAAAKELFDRLFGKSNQPVQVTADVDGNVEVIHKFDHERFADLFFRNRGTSRNGDGAPSGNGN